MFSTKILIESLFHFKQRKKNCQHQVMKCQWSAAFSVWQKNQQNDQELKSEQHLCFSENHYLEWIIWNLLYLISKSISTDKQNQIQNLINDKSISSNGHTIRTNIKALTPDQRAVVILAFTGTTSKTQNYAYRYFSPYSNAACYFDPWLLWNKAADSIRTSRNAFDNIIKRKYCQPVPFLQTWNSNSRNYINRTKGPYPEEPVQYPPML